MAGVPIFGTKISKKASSCKLRNVSTFLQWQAKKRFFIEASLLTREAKTVYSPGNIGEHYWPFDSPENSKLAPRTKHKI